MRIRYRSKQCNLDGFVLSGPAVREAEYDGSSQSQVKK